MNNDVKRRVTTVSPDQSVDTTIRKMAQKEGVDKIYGIAVVLDREDRVQGVLTDGDIRRAYAKGIEFDQPVSNIMITDPITLQNDEKPRNIVGLVSAQAARRSRLSADMIGHVIVVDEEGKLVDVIDVVDLLTRSGSLSENVAVYGLGFIGLPLAVTLANIGHRVYGVDLDPAVRESIEAGRVGFHEPGLQDMTALVLENEALTIHDKLNESVCNVHIIAVGTPVDSDGTIDESSVLGAADSVARVLKKDDLVQLRSTVPIGCTSTRFLKRLVADRKLVPGQDFYLAFTPERTVEGDALRELRSLPQIVGGYSNRCVEKAATFWSSVTNTIVRVDSLEAAEVIKLANNTFRDLSFGFANELAAMCDRFNLDAFEVIEAANEGYPRDRIPKPSPGVGGYCLTKDPMIYDRSLHGEGDRRSLGFYSRAANVEAGEYPGVVLERWLKLAGKKMEEVQVLCLGMAFKGYPETNDLRGSTALMFARWCGTRTLSTMVWDAVVGPEELRHHCLEPVEDVRLALAMADAVFILNNHPAHSLIGIPRILNEARKTRLVFDGWHQLDRDELEHIPDTVYSTMGYISETRSI